MLKKIVSLVVFVTGFLTAMPQLQANDRPTITIGLIDTFSPTFYIKTYAPTLEHLIQALPQYRFNVVEIDYQQIEEDITRLCPAFIVTSASGFVSLIDQFGAHQVATKKPKGSKSVSNTVASTFVVRADSAIQTLSDAKGSRVAVQSKESFDGWLIAKGNIAERFGGADSFFSKVISTEYGLPDVAMLVKMGFADVGVLGTCEYEMLVKTGQLDSKSFRILEERSNGEGCVRSTEQYPDVVFSSLPHIDNDVTKDVTLALLSMPDKDFDFTWTIANDFLPTYNLLKSLQLGPYAPQPWSAELIWRTYRTEILLFLGLILAVIFHIVTINRLVRLRTAELSEALVKTEQFHLEVQRVRSRLLQVERLSIVSQLSSMFAHEIKQPIMNISLYGAALRMLLRKEDALSQKADELIGKLEGEIERSAEIVEHVRSYAKKSETRREVCELGKIARDVRQSVQVAVPIRLKVTTSPVVFADPFELQYIIANFLKNARSVVKYVQDPLIEVEVYEVDDKALLSVSDNGPKIADDVFESLGHVRMSDKPDGLGFGLSIAVTLAEKMGGHIEFARRAPNGLKVTLVLRKMK